MKNPDSRNAYGDLPLDDLVFDTAKAMLEKLVRVGRHRNGWCDPAFRPRLVEMLQEHVERAKDNPEQWLDVANLAAMLWYLRDDSEETQV